MECDTRLGSLTAYELTLAFRALLLFPQQDMVKVVRNWTPARRRRCEALLVDLHGEVVEGTRTSVWIRDGDRLWTPHLAAGGLPGVMRAHLLATRTDTGEDALRPDDLRAADAIYLSNALRGWMPVRLVE